MKQIPTSNWPAWTYFRKFWIAWLVVAIVFFFFIYFIQFHKSALVNTPPRGEVIVAFGDSITAGNGASDPQHSYPAQLAQFLGKPVVNRGVGGNSTYDALARLEQDVVALQPGLVILILGGIDEMQGIPMDTTMKNISLIVERLQAVGAMVVFGGIDPPMAGWRFRHIRKLSQEMGVLYIDGIMEGLWGNTQLMADAIHPNDAGYRLVAERIYRAIGKYYKK